MFNCILIRNVNRPVNLTERAISTYGSFWHLYFLKVLFSLISYVSSSSRLQTVEEEEDCIKH